MKSRKILWAVGAALLLSGCFKKVSHETDYVIKPLVQTLSGATNDPFEGALAYSFNVDTTEYTVATYDDAAAGIVSRKSNPAEKISTPAATAEPYTQEGMTGWIHMTLGKTSQMVLAVDPVNRLYAYTQQKTDVNLPTLYVTLIFKPWKEGFSYQDGKWSVYNAFYTPPTYLTCYITPTAQSTEGGESTSISSATPAPKVYAFAADTTLWYLASYDDAVSGRLTSKSNPAETKDSPLFQGYKQTDSEQFAIEKISSTPLMLIVVDRVNQRYAYTKKEVDLAGEPLSLSIVFRLWRPEWIYVEEGWCVVNPAKKPTTTTTAINRNR